MKNLKQTKWTSEKVEKLKELCFEEKTNKEIAGMLGVSVKDVYSKRSQLGITMDKVKEQKEQVKAEEPPSRDRLTEAFKKLDDELMIKMLHATNDEKRVLYLAHSIIIAANFKALNDALKIIENKI